MDKVSQSRRAIELGIDDQMFADLCKLNKSFVFANFGNIRDDFRIEKVFSGTEQIAPKLETRTAVVVHKGRVPHL